MLTCFSIRSPLAADGLVYVQLFRLAVQNKNRKNNFRPTQRIILHPVLTTVYITTMIRRTIWRVIRDIDIIVCVSRSVCHYRRSHC